MSKNQNNAVIIGESHCAKTNPELWGLFVTWFRTKGREPRPGLWTESEVEALFWIRSPIKNTNQNPSDGD